MSPRPRWTDEALIKAVREAKCLQDVIVTLNLSSNTKTRDRLRKHITRLNLSTDHLEVHPYRRPTSNTIIRTEKQCCRCKHILPIDNFRPHSGAKDGHHGYCIDCKIPAKTRPTCSCGTPMAYRAKQCAVCWKETRKDVNNPNWKGTWLRPDGYRMVHIIDHPRRRVNYPYVLEHILVMEEHIGRYLYPEENVHHLNGVRSDNRIENLELWCKPQPNGIRAIDALRWAETIMERYNELKQKIEESGDLFPDD